MNIPQLTYSAADWVLLAAIVPLTLYAITYASKSRWQDTLAGRASMLQTIAWILVFISGVLVIFLGADYTIRPYVRMIVFLLLNLALWFSYYVLRKYIAFQRGKAPDPDNLHEADDLHARRLG